MPLSRLFVIFFECSITSLNFVENIFAKNNFDNLADLDISEFNIFDNNETISFFDLFFNVNFDNFA